MEQGKKAVVVRHNGGAQAGHTVEGKNFRFVFHQLGSGCFRETPFYWSETQVFLFLLEVQMRWQYMENLPVIGTLLYL